MCNKFNNNEWIGRKPHIHHEKNGVEFIACFFIHDSLRLIIIIIFKHRAHVHSLQSCTIIGNIFRLRGVYYNLSKLLIALVDFDRQGSKERKNGKNRN